jgi:N-methylhydantoinase A
VSFRLGIDIGGTFTDFVLVDADGQISLYKTNSTPLDPAAAISEGLNLIADSLGLTEEALLDDVDMVIHGTTAATNALIQRTGAKTGLLCTEGFRDSFEIRLGFKEERYDFTYPPPPVLVPRYLRLPVRERITKGGEIAVPLDEAQARTAIRTLKAEGVEAVAVSFLWSFLTPVHERRVGELLAEEFPDAFRSLSIEVLPQIREYERTRTTILNAYLGPILETYVERTEGMLRSKGFKNRVRYMQANAGLASGAALLRKPIYALNSGPAAGPTAGIFFGRQLGHENVISVDMGGTSFDICLVEDGLPDTVKDVDVCRYRVGIPMININTIGAGGGSIAWADGGGILRVGPQSAEAVPGPACYRRGGSEPTVTDANVVLGYFSPTALLAGRLEIDQEAAYRAIREKVAEPLGLTVEEASHGIFEVVNHNMTSGIREVSVERGYDPRDFAMVVGGGAGPVHAGRLAAELEVPIAIVPKVASAFCAFGEVVADLRHDHNASYAGRLRAIDLQRLNELLDSLEMAGRSELAEEGVAPEAISVTRSLELRYLGQVHEVAVPLPYGRIEEKTLDRIEKLFHQKHEALYSYSERDGICELINLAVTARGKVPKVNPPTLAVAEEDPTPALKGNRLAFFPEFGGYLETPVFDGGDAAAGNVFVGPAIVEEPTTTIVVFPRSTMRLDERGFYVMSIPSPLTEQARGELRTPAVATGASQGAI